MKKITIAFVTVFLFSFLIITSGSGIKVYIYGMKVPQEVISVKGDTRNAVDIKFIGLINLVKIDSEGPKVFCFFHNSDKQCIYVDAAKADRNDRIDVDFHHTFVTTDFVLFLNEIRKKKNANMCTGHMAQKCKGDLA